MGLAAIRHNLGNRGVGRQAVRGTAHTDDKHSPGVWESRAWPAAGVRRLRLPRSGLPRLTRPTHLPIALSISA
jgi:hypothetical protein